jgi:hypothetical protein
MNYGKANQTGMRAAPCRADEKKYYKETMPACKESLLQKVTDQSEYIGSVR